MRGNTRLLLAAFGLMAPMGLQPLWAQQASTDIVKDAIEPYIPGRERARFLKAAGADSELEQSEFTANGQTADGFARKFDKWPTLVQFDRNTDTTIDWFEADAYRRALRSAVVAKYDKNSNNRLDGEELVAAAADLEKGVVPAVSAERPQVASTIPGSTPAPEGRRNRGGFGGGTFAERQARAQEFQQSTLQQFDSNGDGKISETERAAMPLQQQWFSRAIDLATTHFDSNGDGKIDESEEQQIAAFGQQVQENGRKLEVQLLDTNGDGSVDDGERQAVQQKAQAVAFQLLPKLINVADTNGDGQVDPEERRAGFQRLSGVAAEQIDVWTKKFDANSDGKLSADERTALIQGVNDDLLARIKKFDASGSGKLANLTPAEITSVAESWLTEVGILGGSR